jgi:hypothetical protein
MARLSNKRSLTAAVFPLSPPYPHYTRIMETLGKLLSPLSMGTSAVQDTVVSTSVALIFALLSCNYSDTIYVYLLEMHPFLLRLETCRYRWNRRNRQTY